MGSALARGGWTGAQFSLLRIATGLAAFHWALTHWVWTPSIVLPVAALLMAAGWFTRWAALAVLVLTTPLLSAAMPLFVLAPEGPYGAVRQFDEWRISARSLWIARIVTLALLYLSLSEGVIGTLWPMGCFAALSLLPPGWIPGRAPGTTEKLYYDGHCGLCHNFVQFLLSEDADGSRFRFAPIDSASFHEHIPESIRGTLPDSVVVWTAQGQALTRSAAVLHVLRRLGGYWRILALLATPLPRAPLDAVYDFIARIRVRLFARPAGVCPLMPRELRSRFDV